jgi:hypothetical protein
MILGVIPSPQILRALLIDRKTRPSVIPLALRARTVARFPRPPYPPDRELNLVRNNFSPPDSRGTEPS